MGTSLSRPRVRGSVVLGRPEARKTAKNRAVEVVLALAHMAGRTGSHNLNDQGCRCFGNAVIAFHQQCPQVDKTLQIIVDDRKGACTHTHGTPNRG